MEGDYELGYGHAEEGKPPLSLRLFRNYGVIVDWGGRTKGGKAPIIIISLGCHPTGEVVELAWLMRWANRIRVSGDIEPNEKIN